MKRTEILFLLLILPLLFTGCEKTDDGTHVDPITIYEKLPGTWILSSLKLVDEVAKASSLDLYEMELKPVFGFSSFAITFNIDSSYLPTSYEVTGDAPELFSNSGYWDLDSPFTHTDGNPTQLNLYSDEAKTLLVDQLNVTTLPGAVNTLEFRLVRLAEGSPYVTYIYKLRLDN
jgi:hypothetical protein